MNLDHVRSLAFAPIIQTYDARDSALYALSLGMGDDPLDEDELPYVYEGRSGLAAPNLCVTLGWPPFWHRAPETGIAWRRILHGEQSFRLSGPLANAGEVRAEQRILAAEDKGAARGAILYTARPLRRGYGRNDSGTALRRIPARRRRRRRFRRTPEVDQTARRRQARSRSGIAHVPSRRAPYRQASRDYMPIHADPDVAREAGFARPISHGLNTFGLACRAALKSYAPRQPQRIAAMTARFSSPALPGDTIRVELFEASGALRFRAIAVERGVVTLDRGEIELR